VLLATAWYALFDLIVDSGNAYRITATWSTVEGGPRYQSAGSVRCAPEISTI
jgi:hypothetical protein